MLKCLFITLSESKIYGERIQREISFRFKTAFMHNLQNESLLVVLTASNLPTTPLFLRVSATTTTRTTLSSRPSMTTDVSQGHTTGALTVTESTRPRTARTSARTVALLTPAILTLVLVATLSAPPVDSAPTPGME